MIFLRPIFWFAILFLYKIGRGGASEVNDDEQKQLEKNLRSLRNDFNRIIETLEDFAGDFLMQLHNTGKLVESRYITDNDYNWQDDTLNTIEKTSEHSYSSLPIIPETPKTIHGKAPTLPKLHLPKIPNLITKNIQQQELSNDVENREKRSTHMVQEFENRPPAPIMPQDGQGLPVQIPENFGQRSAEPVMPEFSPFPDKIIQNRENSREPDFYFDDNGGPRSAAPIVLPELTPFTDKSTNVRRDKIQENFLEAKESIPSERSQTSTSFLPNQKPKDPIICAVKTQKEIDLEKQKMVELREEVKKLNELVALLKDQQKVIKMFNDVDKDLESNDIFDGNNDNNIKNSFLYRNIKKLLNNRKNDEESSDKNGTSDVKAKEFKSGKSDTQILNPGPTFEDLDKIRIDLRTTAENLNNTKELLITEKHREEHFAQELKRQNSELKFLKVMTESLYDKIGEKSEDSKKGTEHDKKLRKSDFQDIDVDSLLESVHIPKIMPTQRQKYSGAPAFPKFNPSSNTRESNPGDNRNDNMHQFLSMLNNEENKNERNQNEKNQNGERLNENNEATFPENLQINLNKENNTYLPVNARASSSGKMDDIDLKLKLLEVLAKEGRSDDTNSKEKVLNEAMKKLLVPEKKSDDDQLDALLDLFKEKNEPKSEKELSQKTLKKLFRDLTAQPQSKSDDDVESELKQLQKAISGLRPKEDQLLDNLDLVNNRRGKQDGGDIQSMLSQIIAQNGGIVAPSTGVDLGGTADVASVINANGGAVSAASFDLPGVLSSNSGGKYTPQQILQLSKIMGAHNNYNGGAGSSYSGNSNPAVQKLLGQYIASSNMAHQASYGHGYPLYTNSPMNYGSGTAGIYSGIGSNAYRPNSNAYSPNSNYGIGTNSYPSSSVPYRPHSNLYEGSINSYGPNINPYGSNIYPYDAKLYGPNPNSYAYSFHNVPYSNPYSGSYESGLEDYGASPIYLSPNSGDYISGNNYNSPYHSTSSDGYPGDASLPHYTIPALSSYDVSAPNYLPSKNGYQPPSYTNIVPGVYPIGTQTPTNYPNGPSGYGKIGYSGQGGIGSQQYGSGGYAGGNLGPSNHNIPGYGKTGYSGPGAISSQNYGSGGYSASGASYQGLSNDYSGVTQGNKAGYGYTGEQSNADVYPSYGQRFFPSAGPAENIGAIYQGNNYGSKSYGGPSLDQPYGNGQNSEQYKNSLASDLAKQIESLESAITGLNRHDYSQTASDKATVASLEQKIYDLKGVISSLNQPPYRTQQSYENTQLSYESNPLEAYSQNQGFYKQPENPYSANHISYGGVSQNGASLNTYGAPSQTSYQQSAISGQIASNVPNHNSYITYGSAAAPQPSYSSTSQAPVSQQYPENKPNYTPNQPNSPNYSASKPNQPTNPPLPNQASSPDNTHPPVAYQPSPPQNSPPYQPKRAFGEDRSRSHGLRKDLHRVRNTVEEKIRRKRQVDAMEASPMSLQMPPQISPQIPQQISPQRSPDVPSQAADMTINMKQNYDGENRPVQYNFGEDALTQIANTFKKYLEETLTSEENGNDPKLYQPVNNQESRNSAVASLQEKLDFIKKQLESRQQSGRSLNSLYGPPSIPNHIPFATALTPYGSNNYFLNNHHFQAPSITSLDKPISDKKQDFFTQIVLKILEKVLGALPSVLHRLFGNLATTVGNSYGDNYNPLQNLLKNLGAVGYVPLILIKLLDSVSVIMQHLKKNKFFKHYLLPAGGVAIAGLYISFLIFFYQQDEPYGYIGYQGNGKYPQYDSSSYGHNNYDATDYDNYGNYGYHGNYGNHDNYGNYGYHGNYRSNSDYYSSNPIYRPPLPYYRDRFYDNMQQPLPGNNDLYKDNKRTFLSNYDTNFYKSNREQVPDISNVRPNNGLDYGGTSINNPYDVGGNAPLRYSRGYYDYFKDSMSSTNKNRYR